LVVWQDQDDALSCADHATGRIRWHLSPEAGGEPLAIAGGCVYLRVSRHEGVAAQFMRVVDASHGGRVLSVHKYDPSESSLFRTPRLLLGPNDVAVLSQSLVGAGVEEAKVLALDLARDRVLWVKNGLRADALSGTTVLCSAAGRGGKSGTHGVDLHTGRQRWRSAAPFGFVGEHSEHSAVWVVTGAGPQTSRGSDARATAVTGVRPLDGKQVWSLRLAKGPDIQGLRVVGGRLIVIRDGLSPSGPACLEAYRLP
jgi:hypothetical protein